MVASPSSSSSSSSSQQPSKLPQCWGHRGASATFPENTLASFAAAMRDGAEGIESDLHITSDGVIVCAHDAHLDRCTNGTGLIKEQPYYGGIDQLLSTKLPAQPIPTFAQTLDLLCRPENSHVVFNIDCKVNNDPERLFALMHETISKIPDYEAKLASRLILGLWHPRFVAPARQYLPYVRPTHIGMSIALARTYFWKDCSGFSMAFACLTGRDGEAFRAECKAAGKDLFVWTVNDRLQMVQAMKWGVHAILTDRTDELIKLRHEAVANWPAISKETTAFFSWSSLSYFSAIHMLTAAWESYQLQRIAGPLFVPPTAIAAVASVPPAIAIRPAPATARA